MDGTSVSKQLKTDDALEEVFSAITDVYSYHIHERSNLYPCTVKPTNRGGRLREELLTSQGSYNVALLFIFGHLKLSSSSEVDTSLTEPVPGPLIYRGLLHRRHKWGPGCAF